ncbi:MAG: hypothetical protein JWM56_165 [Candidatus Peribacteria bacterium]|nr:hypothetical protein [Candidatus Peribacteria bacterium]
MSAPESPREIPQKHIANLEAKKESIIRAIHHELDQRRERHKISIVALRGDTDNESLEKQIGALEADVIACNADTAIATVYLEDWGTYYKQPDGSWFGPGGNFPAGCELAIKLDAKLMEANNQPLL